MLETRIEKKGNAIIIVRFSAKGKDSMAEMDLQEISCAEFCENENFDVLKVFREEVDYKPAEYKKAWKDLLKLYKKNHQVNLAVADYSAFQTTEEFNYVRKKLKKRGIMLLIPEEEGRAGCDAVFKLMRLFFPVFKELQREIRLGHLNEEPKAMMNPDEDCPCSTYNN